MDAILLLKASVLLSVTLVAARLLRRAPAVTRHRLWSIVFAAVLALPLLAAVLPALDVTVPAGWVPAAAERVNPGPLNRSTGAQNGGAGPVDAPALDHGRPPSSPPPPSSYTVTPLAAAWPGASTLLLVAWVAGTAAAAGALVLSLVRVRRLARTAENVRDQVWLSAAAAMAARLGLRSHVRLLMSPEVGTPMAGGVWRTAIFLPVSARAWSVEQRDVVLAHEIAHLAVHDPLRHLVARLAFALYWFHPLAWIAARQAAAAREQACDETVLALGTRRSVYARVLLELAESTRPPSRALGALPMVERSRLENRVMAILNDDPCPVTSRLALIPVSGIALLALALAVAQPSASASSPSTPAAAEPSALAGTRAKPTAARLEPIQLPDTVAGGVPQAERGRDSACWWDPAEGTSFSGTMSTTDTGGRVVVHEQVGTRGSDRVIQKSFGDLRLCMMATDVGDNDSAGRPSEWIGRASRVVLEAHQRGMIQRMEFGRGAGGAAPASWLVAGVQRPFNDAARQWRDRMLAVLDTTWEVSALRGEVSSLRGQISSILGNRSSLQGEISSLGGEVSSMRGRESSVRGEESSLRGRISSIQGHVSSLRGAISSEQGAISSLNAGGYRADDSARVRIAEHVAGIARIEQEIRDYGADARIAGVEREIAALAADGKAAAIEAEIRAFDLNGKVAAIERRIVALDVDGRVAAIERRIAALDADVRTRQLEQRRDDELKRLEAAIAAIR